MFSLFFVSVAATAFACNYKNCSECTASSCEESHNGCVWNGECTLCKSYTDGDSCKQKRQCFWTGFHCVYEDFDFLCKESCDTCYDDYLCWSYHRCNWNNLTGTCDRPCACDVCEDENLCATSPGNCSWDSSANFCYKSCACEDCENAKMCSTNNCSWDSSANFCYQSCTCKDCERTKSCGINNCTWDSRGNLCYNESRSLCEDFAYPDLCSTNNCWWDSSTNSCLNKSCACNNCINENFCTTNDCTWDSLANSCSETQMNTPVAAKGKPMWFYFLVIGAPIVTVVVIVIVVVIVWKSKRSGYSKVEN